MTSPEPVIADAAAALAALPDPLRRHLADTVLPLCGWRPGDPAAPAPDLAGRRIGFFRRNLRRGGSGRVLIEQLAALSAAGGSADLYYFEEGVDPDVVAEIRTRAPGVRRIRRVSRRLASFRSLALELPFRRLDLLVSTDIHDPFIYAATAARFGLPAPPPLAAVMHEEYDRYLAFLRPHADRLSAVCLDYDFTARFRALYGPGVPAGLVSPLFPLSVQQADRAESRRALGLPGDAAVMAYAGRLDRNKRIGFLAGVLEDLLGGGRTDVWLLLAGRWEDDAFRDETLAAFNREVRLPDGRRLRLADRLRVPGPVPSLAPAFAAADVFVFPSRTEGFYPLVVMEAQAAGLPVVCFGAGGLGRVILDGVTGCLAPGAPGPEGVEEVADSRRIFGDRVRGLLADPAAARALGGNGRLAVDFLTRHYPFARLFLEWVQSVLAGRRQP